MENNVYFIFHRKDSCTFLDFETNLTSVKLERKEENEVQLKVSTDYAIRIVLYIAIKKDIVQSKELSETLGIPQSTVFKIGKKLSDNEIISIATGIQGGFKLKKHPKDISIFSIIDIFVLRKINIVADLLQKLALFEKFIVQCKNILKNI